MKSNENLLPRSNPKVISIACGLTVRQADLDLFVALAVEAEEAMQECVRQRAKILNALKAGAAVEPGAFTARMAWDVFLEDRRLIIDRLPSAGAACR
jgi:hypothetical protein